MNRLLWLGMVVVVGGLFAWCRREVASAPEPEPERGAMMRYPSMTNGELETEWEKHFDPERHPAVGKFMEGAGQRRAQFGIERTECYGTCPAYTFIVNVDGSFHYEGRRFAKRAGRWHGQVDPTSLALAWQQITDANFLDLSNGYSKEVTDSPTVFTLVETKGRRKIVLDYAQAGPAKLQALEAAIDALQQHAQWEKD